MSSEDIRNRRWTEKEKTALRRAAALQASGEDTKLNLSDAPRLTGAELANLVRLRDVPKKVAVSVRLDPRVLEWLKSKGQGHLTRINDVLTNLMEAERGADLRR
ncbi:MAG: BrnA antitoxin family protein [Acidobacteriota bacterium]